MPELPEVETKKELLKPYLLGKTILNVKVLHPKIIEHPAVEVFINNLKKQTINDIKRRGKWLIFELDDNYLLIHLRMEGTFFIRDTKNPLAKHDYVIFSLSNGTDLRYNDTRKFGKMHLISKTEFCQYPLLNELGEEPFSKDLTVTYLKNKYKNKTIPIKTALLDQKIIAGIGNIYADEILFKSHISPLRKTNQLSDLELQTIIDSTKQVLEKAIELKGTSVRSYIPQEGKHGKFQQELKVYDKKNQPCFVCQEIISKITVNGRGTHYCSKCQK